MMENSNSDAEFAISIRQPWATLVVHRIKTVEIRSWPTAQRGPIWIHAASMSDASDEGWQHLPDDLQLAAKQKGGLIGRAELVDCVTYENKDAFARDRTKHLNAPEWFRKPVLYGFVLDNAEPSEFRPMRGWVRIFRIMEGTQP